MGWLALHRRRSALAQALSSERLDGLGRRVMRVLHAVIVESVFHWDADALRLSSAVLSVLAQALEAEAHTRSALGAAVTAARLAGESPAEDGERLFTFGTAALPLVGGGNEFDEALAGRLFPDGDDHQRENVRGRGVSMRFKLNRSRVGS